MIEIMTQLKLIISGGGTGGHIFPAIAIAKSIERKIENVEILFIGSMDRMEMQKVPEAGYNIKGLWISGLQRNFSFRNLLFPFKLITSLVKANRILRNFKPDIVIGTGGFASGPVLYVAARSGIPCVVQEQNSYPGITNRLLSKYVKKVCVAYDHMERFFPNEKIVFTGNPIRKSILSSNDNDGKDFFNVNNGRTTVLVIGGSLGARTINESIAESLLRFKNEKINLIWQTGLSFQETSESLIQEINTEGISCHVFIREMEMAYSAADIIISRAGAIAISELCSIGKPTILVPSPNVAEDHQTKNAQSLVNKKSALMVKDVDAKLKLVDELMFLAGNGSLQEELSNNIRQLAVGNAAERIAEIALDLIST